jgi:hypothetical protein
LLLLLLLLQVVGLCSGRHGRHCCSLVEVGHVVGSSNGRGRAGVVCPVGRDNVGWKVSEDFTLLLLPLPPSTEKTKISSRPWTLKR